MDKAAARQHEFRVGVDRLLLFSRSQTELEVDSSRQLAVELLYGLSTGAQAQVMSALLLIDGGLELAARANARAALELAVTAQWAHLTPGGLERLHEGLCQAGYDLHKSTAPYMSHPLPTEVLTIIEDWRNAKGLPSFKERRLVFEPHDGLIGYLYKFTSQSVHVTPAIVAGYIETSDRTPTPTLLMDTKDEFVVLTLQTLAISAALAIGLTEEIRAGRPHFAHIEAIADRMGVPCTLRHDYCGPAT